MARKNKNHHMEQRGNTWCFVAMASGERVRMSLSTSVTEARRLRDQYLNEINLYGEIQSIKPQSLNDRGDEILFGEVAEKWAKVVAKKIKASTLNDYKSAMNYYILPQFGNRPISKITFIDIETFMAELTCSAKRVNK